MIVWQCAVLELTRLPLGKLAFGDVCNKAVPKRGAVCFSLWDGIAKQPSHRAIVELDPELQVPWAQVARRCPDRLHNMSAVIRVKRRKNLACIFAQFFRIDPEDITNSIACKRNTTRAIRAHPDLTID